MDNNYISILIESLEKKVKVLDAIHDENALQSDILDAEKFDDEAFDATIDRKEELIRQLTLLDSGFEKIYGRVREVLTEQKDLHKDQIRKLQALIVQVTERGTRIEAEEARNSQKLQQRLATERRQVRTTRKNAQVVNSYYSSMGSAQGQAPSRFLDSKN